MKKGSNKILYARTAKERMLWLRVFCRVIDVNNGMSHPFNSYSPEFKKCKELAKKGIEKIGKAATDFHNNGKLPQNRLSTAQNLPALTYKSPHLDFNYFCVQGCLFKKIENVKIYHESSFHKKYYRVNF